MRKNIRLLSLILPLLATLASTVAEPRLFFSSEEISALRLKSQTPEGVAIVNAMVSAMLPNPVLSYDVATEARDAALLYVLTGNETYAQRALSMSLAVTQDASFWNVDSSKGLTRAFMNMGVAVAYDLCKDSASWAADRQGLSQQLRANSDSLYRNGGAGWPGDNKPGNNWHAVVFNAAAIGYLASDEAGTQANLYGGNKNVYSRVLNHLNANLTRFGTNQDDAIYNGWNPEGTGYTMYPWNFTGPTGQALDRLRGVDITQDGPASTSLTLWAQYPGAIPILQSAAYGGTRGLHPDYSDDNPGWGSNGSLVTAFAYAPEAYKAGMKWQFDRTFGLQGDNRWDNGRGSALFSLLYYPSSLKAVDPTRAYERTYQGRLQNGRAYVDASYGMTIFRNRYQDEGDAVTELSARGQNSWGGHSGPDMNGVRIIALNVPWIVGPGRTGSAAGQSTVFKTAPESTTTSSNYGVLSGYQNNERGDGWAITSSVNGSTGTTTSSMNVTNHVRRVLTDYSGRSGADGLWLIGDTSTDGVYWRINTPEFNKITLSVGGDSRNFQLEGPNGTRLFGRVLVGDPATLSLGVFARDNPTDPNSVGYPYQGQFYYNNTTLTFQQDAANPGNFLVVFGAYQPGSTFPTIAYSPSGGTGINGTVTVNEQTLAIAGVSSDQFSVASWAPTTYEWLKDGSGSWATFGNWSPTGQPDSSADAIALGRSAGGAISLPGEKVVNQVTFGAGAGAYSLGTAGQVLWIKDNPSYLLGSGTIRQDSVGTQTILSDVQTPQTLSLVINQGTLNLAGAVVASSISKQGGGAARISGSLDVASDMGVAVSQGSLTVTGALRGQGGAHTLSVTAGTLTLAGTVDVEDASHLQLSGSFQGAVDKTGAGTLSLDTAPVSLSSMTIRQGAVRATDGSSLPSATPLRLRGGVLESSGTFARTLGSASGQVNWTDATDAGSGGFSATSAGLTVSLNGGSALTWGQASLVPAGQSIVLGSQTAEGAVTISNAIDLADGNRSFDVRKSLSSGQDLGVLGGTVSNGAVTKTGLGTLVLAAANTYTGTTTIEGGALRAATGVGLPSASTLRLRGGVFESSGTFSRDIGTGAGQINWSDATDSGSGGFAAAGSDLGVTLNSGAGLTWGASGFVQSGRALVLGSTTADSVVTLTNAIDLAGASQTVEVRGNTFASGDRAVLGGTLSNGGLAKTGAGTLRLAGTNTYSGDTLVQEGTLEAGVSGAIPAQSSVSIVSGATLDVSIADASAGGLKGHGAVALGSRTLTVGDGGGSSRFDGVIAGTGGLTKTGDGTLTLAGANTYSGTTLVEQGTLELAYDVPLGFAGPAGQSSAAVLVGSTGATAKNASLLLTYGDVVARPVTVQAGNAGTATIGATNALGNTAFLGQITLNKNAQLWAQDGGAVSFLAPVTGTGGINKIGTGTASLESRSSTFSGATTISAGALRANHLVNASTLSPNSVIELRGGVIELDADLPVYPRLEAVDPTTGRIQMTGHGMTAGQPVKFTTWTPNDLSVGRADSGSVVTTVYYVVNPDANGFQVALAAGGSVVVPKSVVPNTGVIKSGTFISAVDSTNDVLTMPGHGLANGTKISFSTLASTPTGISQNAVYYVINATSDTLQVSTTSGGTKVDLTSTTAGAVLKQAGDYVSSVDATADTLTIPGHTLVAGNRVTFTAGSVPTGLSSGTVYYVRDVSGSTFKLATAFNGTAVNITGTQVSGVLTRDFSPVLGTAAGQLNFGVGGGGFAAYRTNRNVDINNDGVSSLAWGTTTNFVGSGQPLIFGSNTATAQVTLIDNINLGASARTVQVENNSYSTSDIAVLSGVLSGTGGSLVKTGAGTLSLTATNTYTGTTTIQAGSLRGASGTGLPTNSILRLRGGLWEGSGTFSRTVGTASGNVNWSDSTDSGTGGFASSSGTLTVNLSSGAGLTWGSGGFVPDGQPLLFGTETAANTVALSNAIALGTQVRTLQVTRGTATLSGALTGTGGIEKTGAGTLIISGTSNSYSGQTRVTFGTLQLGANNALPTAGETYIEYGQALNMPSFSQPLARLAGTGNVNASSGTPTLTVGDATDFTFGGTINNAIAVVKQGSGTMSLTATSSYTGTTTVSSGTLRVTDYGALGSTATGTTVSSGAALALDLGVSIAEPVTAVGTGPGSLGAIQARSGTTSIVALVTLTGNTTLGALADSTLTLAKGVSIAAGATVTTAGAGTVRILGGVTAGTGSSFQVNEGTLQLESDPGAGASIQVGLNGSLNVAPGVDIHAPVAMSGRVRGTGKLSTPITIAEGAVLAPGNSPGTTEFGAGLTWGENGSYEWEINNATGTAGTNWDLANVTGGTLSITATDARKFSIKVIGLTGSNLAGQVQNWDNTKPYSWTIAQAPDGQLQGYAANKFVLDTSAFVNNNPLGGGSLSLWLMGNQIGIGFTPVPLPGTAALAAIGLGALGLRRPRRRK